jgi:hypothetical protein
VDLPTTRSLAKDKELGKLLAIYNQGEADFLSGNLSKTSRKHGEKPKTLYIRDYVTRPDLHSDDDDCLITKGGVQLTVKKNLKKLDCENVSVPQWISANSRIFEILALDMSNKQQRQYHDYTRQIGDLFELYSAPSVLVVDNEHRRQVTKTRRTWNHISSHLERLYLRVKSGQKSSNSMVSKTDSKTDSKTAKSSRYCFAFNTRSGCKHGDDCRYKHACSVKGCGEKHPKWDHERFRSPAQQ